MKENLKRKLWAGVLPVCMIFQLVGTVPVYAEEVNLSDVKQETQAPLREEELNSMNFVIGEVYAVYEEGGFYVATEENPQTSTEVELTDKQTIDHLYIKGDSVSRELMFGCTNLKTVTCADTVTSIGKVAFQVCTSLTSVKIPNVTSIENGAFYGCTSLESLTLGATPPTIGTDVFFTSSPRTTLTIECNSDYQDEVFAEYKAADDGNASDNLWYGWELPISLDNANVPASKGKLMATNTTVDYGETNTAIFTASFAKVGDNKLKALMENQITLLVDDVAVESQIATLIDGVYVATFTVQTNALKAGTYNYTTTFDGNRGLASSKTDAVTLTINKIDQEALNISGVPNKVSYGDTAFLLDITGGSGTGTMTYAVSSGDDVISVTSAGEVGILKAGTARITLTKAGDTNYNDKTGTVEITVQGAEPTITWGVTEHSTPYTGKPILESAFTKPKVTLVNGETFSGTIQYAYKYVGELTQGLFEGYTEGLPTHAGKYEIKAYIAAEGNYTAAESSNTMTLTIKESMPSLTINTMNGKDYDARVVANPTAAQMTITGAKYEDVTFTYSKNSDMSSPLVTAPKDAGIYYVQASANANTLKSEAKRFEITKKTVTVTAKDRDILLGGEVPNLLMPVLGVDYRVEGFLENDTLSGTVSMQYTGTPNNTRHGAYPITISGGTVSDNYSAKYIKGTLFITIDVTLINRAIAAANNAKIGIAAYDTPISSASNGTKFVARTDMEALNTAIQTATDAKITVTTLAQTEAAAKTLDDAVTAFNLCLKWYKVFHYSLTDLFEDLSQES